MFGGKSAVSEFVALVRVTAGFDEEVLVGCCGVDVVGEVDEALSGHALPLASIALVGKAFGCCASPEEDGFLLGEGGVWMVGVWVIRGFVDVVPRAWVEYVVESAGFAL